MYKRQQHDSRCHLYFPKYVILDPLWPLYLPYLIGTSNLTQIGKKWPRYACLRIFKDVGRCHLEFPKSVILDVRWHYQLTKFGANGSRTGRDTSFCVISNMAAATILELLYRFPFWTIHYVPVAGFCVPWQWRNDQPEFVRVIAILPFRDFGWKMVILTRFWVILAEWLLFPVLLFSLLVNMVSKLIVDHSLYILNASNKSARLHLSSSDRKSVRRLWITITLI